MLAPHSGFSFLSVRNPVLFYRGLSQKLVTVRSSGCTAIAPSYYFAPLRWAPGSIAPERADHLNTDKDSKPIGA